VFILSYLIYIEFSQHKNKITIKFTATCFDSKEDYGRTIYVYKVTVRILGSQNAHSYLVNIYGSNIA